MPWSRKKSHLEDCMAEVLSMNEKGLNLTQIINELKIKEPNIFTGKTENKSLYSIIYRREKRRINFGKPTKFIVQPDRNGSIYKLNTKNKENL